MKRTIYFCVCLFTLVCSIQTARSQSHLYIDFGSSHYGLAQYIAATKVEYFRYDLYNTSGYNYVFLYRTTRTPIPFDDEGGWRASVSLEQRLFGSTLKLGGSIYRTRTQSARAFISSDENTLRMIQMFGQTLYPVINDKEPQNVSPVFWKGERDFQTSTAFGEVVFPFGFSLGLFYFYAREEVSQLAHMWSYTDFGTEGGYLWENFITLKSHDYGSTSVFGPTIGYSKSLNLIWLTASFSTSWSTLFGRFNGNVNWTDVDDIKQTLYSFEPIRIRLDGADNHQIRREEVLHLLRLSGRIETDPDAWLGPYIAFNLLSVLNLSHAPRLDFPGGWFVNRGTRILERKETETFLTVSLGVKVNL